MAGRFDPTDVEKLRDAVDIADIIGGYVNLKRGSKGDYWGRCPFHTEKTASFHVVPDRQMFYCFGCGKGGNAFNFLMEMDGVSYGEAVNMLGERYGIEVRSVGGSSESGRQSANERDQLYRVNEMAGKYYHYMLTNTNRSKDAQKAYNYLIERGITDEIIAEYNLGWAENGWDSLVKVIEKKGISLSAAESCGVILKKKSGSGHIDRFRGRIMFPIVNLSGQVVGFGGRRLDGVTDAEDAAKYVNTAETPIYSKGSMLYGLNNARQVIREHDRLFIVEGYTDLLALVQAGFREVAASLGTAFTDGQARLISRFTNNVTIVYDSDTAGVNAATKASEVLIRNSLEVKVALLPTGSDPDSLLREGGSESLATVLENGLSFVQFMLQTTTSGAKGIAPLEWDRTSKTSAAKAILAIIAGVREPVQQELLLQEASESLGVSINALEKSMSQSRSSSTVSSMPVPAKSSFSISQEEIAERDLLRNLMAYPALIQFVSSEVTPELFRNGQLREIYRQLETDYLRGEKFDVRIFPELTEDPALRAFITEAVLSAEEISEEKAREAVTKCIDSLRRRDYSTRILELEAEIRSLGSAGKPTSDKMRELVDLQRQKRMIH
ncbi:DNA primase [Calditrichota bacterium]